MVGLLQEHVAWGGMGEDIEFVLQGHPPHGSIEKENNRLGKDPKEIRIAKKCLK